MATGAPVVIEAALNGATSRAEQPAVPETPEEVAEEAARCAAAGASVVHIHARDAAGPAAEARWYAAAISAIRSRAPGLPVSITTIRPADVPVSATSALLRTLASDPATRPDLISINLGHIALWERPTGGSGRRTVHFPNGYEEVAALLAACEEHGIAPELGVMDLGFVSNAVALRDDGLLPGRPWFLVELDSPAYGAGPQVAPSTVDNYLAIAGALRAHVRGAAWAAHGNGLPGYAVVRQALAEGAHVRVGFEDAVHLPEGRLARSNAELVEWAVRVAQDRGREPATIAEARGLIGLNAV